MSTEQPGLQNESTGENKMLSKNPTERLIPDPIEKLNKDLKEAAKNLGRNEARFLVDAYYIIQEDRKRSGNQDSSLDESEEPHEILSWFFQQNRRLEGYIKAALDIYGDNDPLGRWAKSIIGIGPVLSAGLLAHIDMSKAKTAGAIQTFAGLNDNKMAWLGGKEARKAVLAFVDKDKVLDRQDIINIANKLGCCPKWLSRRIRRVITGQDLPMWGLEKQPEDSYLKIVLGDLEVKVDHVVQSVSKRPWNADLKVLTWKISQSFVWCSGKPESTYGQMYAHRKAMEIAKNEQGEFAEQAKRILEVKRIGKETEAYKAYSQGMLPKAHINARAQRYAVKMFLYHYFEMGCKLHLGIEPPTPYVIQHEGHTHWIKAEDAR